MVVFVGNKECNMKDEELKAKTRKFIVLKKKADKLNKELSISKANLIDAATKISDKRDTIHIEIDEENVCDIKFPIEAVITNDSLLRTLLGDEYPLLVNTKIATRPTKILLEDYKKQDISSCIGYKEKAPSVGLGKAK